MARKPIVQDIVAPGRAPKRGAPESGAAPEHAPVTRVPRPHGDPTRLPRRPPPRERYAHPQPEQPPYASDDARAQAPPEEWVEEEAPREVPERAHTHHRSTSDVGELFPSGRRRRDGSFLESREGSPSWIMVALIVAGAAGGLAFMMSLFFSGATVTVYPRIEENVFVDANFTAAPEPAEGELGYTVMTVEREASQVVEGSREEQVEEFATGEITIFNEFDANPQRLIKNTRFEAPDGSIYRIRESVEVPGMDGETPGSITVPVWADQPGEEYNLSEETRFTIPGFAGSSRFEGFYARSEGAITGGFQGTRISVGEEEQDAARGELQDELVEELDRAVFSSSEKPVGQLLFEDAVFYDFTPQPAREVGEQQVEIVEQGTLEAVLFDTEAFASFLAALVVPEYAGEPVRIENPDELAVSVNPTEGATTTARAGAYDVEVTGTVTFIWEFDEDALRADLAGTSGDTREETLRSYPAIERAETSMRPFWRSHFPRSEDDITINTVLD